MLHVNHQYTILLSRFCMKPGIISMLYALDTTPICLHVPGSYEQSPSLMEAYVSWPETVPPMPGVEHADDRLREHLADAMIESPVKTARPPATTHPGQWTV